MRPVDRVNEYITSPHIEGVRNRTAYYPSEASIISRTDGCVLGKCHRAAWNSWKKIPYSNKIDARGHWTMNFGKELEGMYTRYFKEIGIWAGNNVKYYDPVHNISGEVDIFLFNGTENNGMDGVEIKSAYGYGFQKKVKNYPKIENLLQVGLYLDYWKSNGINLWHLIYHSRDTMENLEYKITLITEKDETFICVDDIPCRMFSIQDIYTRFEQLGKSVIGTEPPPRDYTYGYDLAQSEERLQSGAISKSKFASVKSGKVTDSDWQCLYCSHLNHCWGEKRKEILK